MKTYNVLWVDDEPEKQDGFSELAELNGIILNNFKTSSSGMNELESNLFQYDAIILDAKVFNESENEVAKLTGLMNSISRIKELSSRRVIPYFIFSGQLDVIGNETLSELLGDLPIYRKSIDNDQLFIEIKKAADQLADTQIRHKFTNAFDVCTNKYLGDQSAINLLKILKAFESNDYRDASLLNDIRKIIEDVFKDLDRLKTFSLNCRDLNARSRELSSNPKVPQYIQRSIHSVVVVSQNGSHRLEIDRDVASGKSPYILASTTMELLNVLLWYKDYVDQLV